MPVSVEDLASTSLTLYFAFGTNLSPTQMSLRCTYTHLSSIPIAVARLPNWKWFIQKRGCANIRPIAKADAKLKNRQLPFHAEGTDQVENWQVQSESRGDSGDQNDKQEDEEEDEEVWGILYALHSADVAILDTYEGVDPDAPASMSSYETPLMSNSQRPKEQGKGRHNKVYLDVHIVMWVLHKPENKLELEHQNQYYQGARTVRALVYIDEGDIEEGAVRENYVGRMNRGIREAVALGLSSEWVRRTMRRRVVEGVEAEEGYVGGENRGL